MIGGRKRGKLENKKFKRVMSHGTFPKGCSKHFTPAIRHCSMYERQQLMMLGVLGCFPLKVQQFLSIQICQQMSAIMDLTPFLVTAVLAATIIFTLVVVVCPDLHVFGCRAAHPIHVAAVLHTCLAARQSQKRCTELSRLCMQSGQKYPFGHPRRCSLSLHHSLLRWRSHKSILFLPGAHTFQMFVLKSLPLHPSFCALYAEPMVYCPELVRFHAMLSPTCCWSVRAVAHSSWARATAYGAIACTSPSLKSSSHLSPCIAARTNLFFLEEWLYRRG